MNELQRHVDDYLKLRRSLGFKLRLHGPLLADLVEYLDAAGAMTLTTELAISFAQLSPDVQPIVWAHRLSAVRGFARYLQAIDPATEVPPDHVFATHYQRPTPYLWQEREVLDLMVAARRLRPPLCALTYEALFGLLWCTGLRLSEALNLQLRDFDPARATLEVRDSKNHENRIVPVTGRLAAAVEGYIAAAHPNPEPAHHLFHTGDPSKPADKSTIYNRFRRYLADADIPHFAPGGPHIHSLRHGFAVKNLRRWATDGTDLALTLPYLSAYMGHADLRGTQYYLRLTADAFPQLAAISQVRFGYVIPGPAAPEGAEQ